MGGADLNFSRKYRHKIDKMVVIGDKVWENWLTTLVEPFYHSVKAKFFYPDNKDAAWKWLKE